MVATIVRFNPFPGLRPFKADEAHLFFGREGQADELMRRLRRNLLLAVVGTSGSGKSSLVRAGLLPYLYSGFMVKAGSSWRVAMFRPGDNPIGNLAKALNHPKAFGTEDTESKDAISQIIAETTLRRGALGLVEVVQQAQMPTNENLLVVVDQFEELFRFKQSAPSQDSGDEAAAFVKLLLEATRQKVVPIYVVITMRSDFLGDCAQFRDLPEALNDSQYLVPRMTREQRRIAIEGPVAVGGAKMAPRLVNRLLNDVGDNPDQLPILQHLLMRTWDYWANNHEDGEPIDLRHYEAVGTMAKALSQHADEIYQGLPNSNCQKIAEKLFKCLTEKTTDGRSIRRPTKLQEVCAIAQAKEAEVIDIVEQFCAPSCSFLMPPVGTKLAGDSVLDISHESLIRSWQKLKEWVEEENQLVQIYRRLVDASVLYQKDESGLWRDPELTIALKWLEKNQPNAAWAKRYNSPFEQVMNFLEESTAARDIEIADKEKGERQKEAIKQQRLILFGVGIGFIIATSLGFVGIFGWQNAAISEINSLAKSSDGFLNSDEAKALKSSVKAAVTMQNQLWKVDADTRTQVELALLNTVHKVAAPNTLGGHGKPVNGVSVSPDGKMLASVSDDKTVKLWDISTGKEIKTLTGHTDDVWGVSFSPDGKILASASADKTVKLWDTSTGKEIKSLIGHRREVHRVSFAPSPPSANSADGQMLATASADNTVILWNTDTGKKIKTLTGHTSEVWGVSFSPDGKMLASAGADNTVKLWDTKTFKEIKTLEHEQWVRGVSFSPDSKILASASHDKTVKLWDTQTYEKIKTLDHGGRVLGVSFSPDGKMLASASVDNNLKLWDTETKKELKTLSGHTNEVWGSSFSPDGKMLASASADNTVKLWDIKTKKEIKTLTGHTHPVSRVIFSPDGKIMASATGNDNTVKLWDTQTKKEIKTLSGHKDAVWAVSFSPDGKMLASASVDKTVKLWNTSTGTKIQTLIGHEDQVWGVSFAPNPGSANSRDGHILATASADKTVRLWNTSTGTDIKLAGHKDGVTGVSFSPDGKMLASASIDNTVKLWNSSTGKVIETLTDHEDVVNRVSFSPDGKMLASASDDRTVILWDAQKKTKIKTLTGHKSEVHGVSFAPSLLSANSPDGKILASAGADNTVKLWDTSTGTEIKTLTGHNKTVWGVSFSPDGKMLASASEDNTVKLWRWDFNYLLEEGCNFMDEYFKTNPTEDESDKYLCDGVSE